MDREQHTEGGGAVKLTSKDYRDAANLATQQATNLRVEADQLEEMAGKLNDQAREAEPKPRGRKKKVTTP